MQAIRAFPPSALPFAHTLILGSMPGERSLLAGEYYAHPRNAFWPVVEAVLGIARDWPYRQRLQALREQGYALWDVLASCQRSGSLDSAIRPESVVTNDFAAFFAEHTHITRVFFNGAKAEALFRRQVWPGLSDLYPYLELLRLPSTSPAHAGLSLERKMAAWQAVRMPTSAAD